jgi:UDP-N-acetylmuramate--alanine ligase
VDPVFVQNLAEIPQVLGNLVADGDLVLLMGAGDIGALAQRLPGLLRADRTDAPEVGT